MNDAAGKIADAMPSATLSEEGIREWEALARCEPRKPTKQIPGPSLEFVMLPHAL
jgi:hypothetical protein